MLQKRDGHRPSLFAFNARRVWSVMVCRSVPSMRMV